MALKALKTLKSPERAREVRPLRIVLTLLTHASFPPIFRNSRLNYRIGQSCIIKTSCRSMVCLFLELSSLQEFPRSDRDNYECRTTPPHGEWSIIGEETRGRFGSVRCRHGKKMEICFNTSRGHPERIKAIWYATQQIVRRNGASL